MPRTLRSFARRALPESVYRRYRARKTAATLSGYARRTVTHTYGRERLTVLLADPLAEGWYDRDWKHEPTILPLLREHGALAPGARIFDLGAHQAVIALILAREAGEHGEVIAVEAGAHNARVAAENVALNGARNVRVIHAAGGSAEGFVSFPDDLNAAVDESSSASSLRVPVVTVDGLAREYGKPDLVFLDVEGYEGHVLRGAEATLANGSTSFVVEVHEKIVRFGDSAAAIVDRFDGFDRYVGFDMTPFEPLQGPPPQGRFFLAAIPRR